MNILQVAPYFIPYLGGQEQYIYQLSKKLVKDDHHNVTVLTSNFPQTTPMEEMNGLKVIRKNVLIKPLRNPISPGFLDLNKVASEYDVIHAHNEYSFPSMLAAYLKNNKKPLILTNHLGELNFEDPIINKIGKLYLRTIGKGVWKRCDVIVVLSPSQKEFLTSIEPEISSKIQIIPNAIDIESLKQYSTLKTKNTSVINDIAEDGPKLLYVGQLIKRKGLKWLIMAIHILRNDFPHIRLIMVGDGADEKYFQEMVSQLKLENNIKFMGRVDDLNKLVSLYQQSHAFILPSLSEGLPTVILEAFYFGLPIIATDIPGVREFKEYSTLVPTRDEKKLAEAIKNLFKNDNIEEAYNLALNARKMVETNYNWDVVSQEYERIYQELL